MEQPKEDPQEWVTEDSLDMSCRIEELFLTLIHIVMTRIGKEPRSRVNRKTITALRRIYKKHGRIFEPGAHMRASMVSVVRQQAAGPGQHHG